jgi:hypothetical protein
LGTELSETAKKDKLDLSVISELWMILRMRFYILFNSHNAEKVNELELNHLTTVKMLTILLNPEWKEIVRALTSALACLVKNARDNVGAQQLALQWSSAHTASKRDATLFSCHI